MTQESLNGITSNLLTALAIYDQTARGTGRTERLLSQLRERDVVICGTVREADRLRRELRDRRIQNVRTTYAPPTNDGVMTVVNNYRRSSRFLFDHTFLHAYAEGFVRDLPGIFNHITQLNERLAQQGEPVMSTYDNTRKSI